MCTTVLTTTILYKTLLFSAFSHVLRPLNEKNSMQLEAPVHVTFLYFHNIQQLNYYITLDILDPILNACTLPHCMFYTWAEMSRKYLWALE